MNAQINFFPQKPDWEGTVIEKLNCKKDVPVNDRIFALGRCAFNEESIFCRIWSFECNPKEGSSLTWEIRNKEGRALTARVFYDGTSELIKDGKKEEDRLNTYLISGEDLQGEYWGAIFTLPLNFVENFLGEKLQNGKEIEMSLIKDGGSISSYKGLFRVRK